MLISYHRVSDQLLKNTINACSICLIASRVSIEAWGLGCVGDSSRHGVALGRYMD